MAQEGIGHHNAGLELYQARAMARKTLFSSLPTYRGPQVDSWREYKRAIKRAWQKSLHPAEDVEGRKLSIFDGLRSEAAAQAEMVEEESENLTVEQIWTRLDSLFAPIQESVLSQQEFKQYSQQPSQPAISYLQNKRTLYRAGWPNPESQDLKFLYCEMIKGLASTAIKKQLFREEFVSAEALSNRCLMLIAAERQLQDLGLASDNSLAGLATNSLPLQNSWSADEKMDISAVNLGSGPICYGCNKRGHVKAECRARRGGETSGRGPVSRTCYRCGHKGHFKRECKIPEKNLEAVLKRNREKGQEKSYLKTVDMGPVEEHEEPFEEEDTDLHAAMASIQGFRHGAGL